MCNAYKFSINYSCILLSPMFKMRTRQVFYITEYCITSTQSLKRVYIMSL